MFENLKSFSLHSIPSKPNKDYIAGQLKETHLTVEEAMQAWYEHDALHYLGNQPFSVDGESGVAYLEKRFNRGWLPFGEKYNPFYPIKFYCPHITQELITETANLIRTYQNGTHSTLVKSSTST